MMKGIDVSSHQKNMPSITAAWKWATDTCNAPNVGYSQAYRNQQTINGITYYDCSSFINYALLAGGFTTAGYAPDHNAFTTWSEPTVLSNLGFHRVTDGTLKPGDVGVSNNNSMQHTEMVYAVDSSGTKGQWMGAHTGAYALPNQVSITEYWTSNWFDELWRYENGINVGDTVRPYVLKDYNGNSLASYHDTYTVSELKGDRAVLTVNGQVWAAMNVNNLTKVNGTSVSASSINVGDRVRVTNAVTYDGHGFKTWFDTYTVMELKGDRAVIGVNGTVTAAINVNNLSKA